MEIYAVNAGVTYFIQATSESAAKAEAGRIAAAEYGDDFVYNAWFSAEVTD